MTGRSEIGRIGEEAVCRHLTGLGHRILERNWRSGHLEIDIISLADDGIHFVEVKTRVAPASADPAENVGYLKQRRVAAAAARYMALRKNDFGNMDMMLDVAAVLIDGGGISIDYRPSAFIPMYI